MKKLILLELTLLFLATTFQTDSNPGWFQQTLPRTDISLQEIFFIDSLKGWAVARKSSLDSAYIYYSTNGGNNWVEQLHENTYLTSIHFVDNMTGYCVGSAPPGIIKKTTNAGLNWFTATTIAAAPLQDVKFINKDTGWICSDDFIDGGVFKTINGGFSWQKQFNATGSISPVNLFFLSKDTGWFVTNNSTGRLYRTTNGGVNWVLQFSSGAFADVYFFNRFVGVITSGAVFRTTDGGFNWTQSTSSETGGKMSWGSDSVGWAGQGFNNIAKTTTGGRLWFYQSTPIFNTRSPIALDTLKAWAGGSGLIHTTDGGGPPVGIHQIGNEIPSDFRLFQNYPNPFNPKTIINYELQITNYIKLIVYDINGKSITELVNRKQNAGIYKIEFDGADLPSGIYFYSLFANEKFIDTKKMILIK